MYDMMTQFLGAFNHEKLQTSRRFVSSSTKHTNTLKNEAATISPVPVWPRCANGSAHATWAAPLITAVTLDWVNDDRISAARRRLLVVTWSHLHAVLSRHQPQKPNGAQPESGLGKT